MNMFVKLHLCQWVLRCEPLAKNGWESAHLTFSSYSHFVVKTRGTVVHLSTCMVPHFQVIIKNVHTPDILFTRAFSVRSSNTVRLALLAKERKKMYVFRGILKMHHKEGKITKNIYTQHKTYLLNVFLLKNNFTERNPLYYNLHVTERTVMLLVIVWLPSPFLPHGDAFCWEGGREGRKGHQRSS